MNDGAPLIVRIGEALWGERWQAEMARSEVDVNVNTVQKWRKGVATPRPGVYATLRKEIERRRELLTALLEEMDDGQRD